MEFFGSQPYTFLITGQPGSGKGTTLAFFLEQSRQSEYIEERFWIAPEEVVESYQKQLDHELPEDLRIIVEGDLLGEYRSPERADNRDMAIIDELGLMVDLWASNERMTRKLVKELKLHRQKSYDLLVTDQVFDFVKGIRDRGVVIILTGMTSTLYAALKARLPKKFTDIIEEEFEELCIMGLDNIENIPKGKGEIFIITPEEEFYLEISRPKWYTKELSRYLKKFDVTKESSHSVLEEATIGIESKITQAVCLTYHYCLEVLNLSVKAYGQNTITKEAITNNFQIISPYIFRGRNDELGQRRALSGDGREETKFVKNLHRTADRFEICPYCRDRSLFKAFLKEREERLQKIIEEHPQDEDIEREIEDLAEAIRRNGVRV
ncbi:MAG: hypothetical protein GF308_02425 [Candidatus Heimdallarchaeota archaeon]|nr:hypothetical protein [Candidatus Heimdallarchaeota archaeon]